MNDQVTPQETAVILEYAKACLNLEGDFVELGCYKGDTSILLGKILQDFSTENQDSSTKNDKFSTKKQELSTETQKFSTEKSRFSTEYSKLSTKQTSGRQRKLWIYDSFAGLPEKAPQDNSGAGANFKAGELLVTKREVVSKIHRAGLNNVIIKKAWFSDLTPVDLPQKIAFAFLDGDLYDSIKVSLKLVTPLLTKNAIMIIHDYNNPELPGASRAVDEFLHAHREFQLKVQHSLAILRTEIH